MPDSRLSGNDEAEWISVSLENVFSVFFVCSSSSVSADLFEK